MEGITIVSGLRREGTCRVMKYRIGNTGQALIFSDSVLSHFFKHRQEGPQSKKAGGQLFARFCGNDIRVRLVTGPRHSDRRSALTYVPNRLAERREIRRLFRKGFHYVGDWHTHLEAQPTPSKTDLASMQDMFRKSRHRLASFVLVIVGMDPAPAGLFVGICNETRLKKLIEIA